MKIKECDYNSQPGIKLFENIAFLLKINDRANSSKANRHSKISC
jgi:hypothetical protein